jgi:hypothetical protein
MFMPCSRKQYFLTFMQLKRPMYLFISQYFRGERQALRAAKDIAELLDGEALFAYCSPYKRAIGTWDIIEDYLENNNEKKIDKTNGSDSSEKKDTENKKTGVEIIGMREEPRVAEQQFGNFREFFSSQYIVANMSIIYYAC